MRSFSPSNVARAVSNDSQISGPGGVEEFKMTSPDEIPFDGPDMSSSCFDMDRTACNIGFPFVSVDGVGPQAAKTSNPSNPAKQHHHRCVMC